MALVRGQQKQSFELWWTREWRREMIEEGVDGHKRTCNNPLCNAEPDYSIKCRFDCVACVLIAHACLFYSFELSHLLWLRHQEDQILLVCVSSCCMAGSQICCDRNLRRRRAEATSEADRATCDWKFWQDDRIHNAIIGNIVLHTAGYFDSTFQKDQAVLVHYRYCPNLPLERRFQFDRAERKPAREAYQPYLSTPEDHCLMSFKSAEAAEVWLNKPATSPGDIVIPQISLAWVDGIRRGVFYGGRQVPIPPPDTHVWQYMLPGFLDVCKVSRLPLLRCFTPAKVLSGSFEQWTHSRREKDQMQSSALHSSERSQESQSIAWQPWLLEMYNIGFTMLLAAFDPEYNKCYPRA